MLRRHDHPGSFKTEFTTSKLKELLFISANKIKETI